MDSFTNNNSAHPSGSTNSSGRVSQGTRPNSLDNNNVQNQTPLPIGSVHRLHFHSYVDVPILANPSAADLGRMLLSGHHGPVNTVVTHEVVRPHEEEAMGSHQDVNASSSSHPPPGPSNADFHHGPTHFHLPPPPGFDKPNPAWAPNLNHHHHHHPSQVPYYSTNASTNASTSRDGATTSTAPLDVAPLAVNASVPETESRDYIWVSDNDDIPEGIPLVTAIPVPYGTPASPPAPPPAPAAAPAEPQRDLGAGGSRDGRIRSLPRLREGDPFRCPLCMEPFKLSQLYANHVRVVHLKNETKEQKEARRARRCTARTGRRGRRRRVHADNALPREATAVAEDAGGSGVAPVEVHLPPHSLFTGESLRHVRRIARQVQAPAAPAELEVAAADGGGGRRDKGKGVVAWA